MAKTDPSEAVTGAAKAPAGEGAAGVDAAVVETPNPPADVAAGGAVPEAGPDEEPAAALEPSDQPTLPNVNTTPTRRSKKPRPPPSDDDELQDDIYRVKVEGFEGPLDLLLHLIRKHELDILDIPISFITSKYLEYLKLMQGLHIDVASEYLVMAATLAHIKSKTLLPPDPSDTSDEDGDQEEVDPRQELVRRLLEYQKYKGAAADLRRRSIQALDTFPRGAREPVPEGPAALAPVSMFRLFDAFDKVLKRANQSADHQVLFEKMSITERVVELTELLHQRRRLRFEQLFLRPSPSEPYGAPTRDDLIITFLALLEMCKMRIARVVQRDSLGDLSVELASKHLGQDDAHEPFEMDDGDEPAEPSESFDAAPADADEWQAAPASGEPAAASEPPDVSEPPAHSEPPAASEPPAHTDPAPSDEPAHELFQRALAAEFRRLSHARLRRVLPPPNASAAAAPNRIELFRAASHERLHAAIAFSAETAAIPSAPAVERAAAFTAEPSATAANEQPPEFVTEPAAQPAEPAADSVAASFAERMGPGLRRGVPVVVSPLPPAPLDPRAFRQAARDQLRHPLVAAASPASTNPSAAVETLPSPIDLPASASQQFRRAANHQLTSTARLASTADFKTAVPDKP